MSRMWCDNCKKAVDATITRDYFYHDEVDSRKKEWFELKTCPECGEDLSAEVEICKCGNEMEQFDDYCPDCIEIGQEAIEEAVNYIRERKDIDARELLKYLLEEI